MPGLFVQLPFLSLPPREDVLHAALLHSLQSHAKCLRYHLSLFPKGVHLGSEPGVQAPYLFLSPEGAVSVLGASVRFHRVKLVAEFHTGCVDLCAVCGAQGASVAGHTCLLPWVATSFFFALFRLISSVFWVQQERSRPPEAVLVGSDPKAGEAVPSLCFCLETERYPIVLCLLHW